MSDRDPGHRSRRSARFEIRPTLGRTALFNLVLSGGLLPPPRRCARNEKKDKRSLVEKEIDTGACLIDVRFDDGRRVEQKRPDGFMPSSIAFQQLLTQLFIRDGRQLRAR